MHAPRLPDGPVVSRALLASLPEYLRQPAFARTGGMHATGLFTPAGELVLAREDVGRHNAMDKVVGRALRDGLLPLHDAILCVSGRLSFELVQKAAVAGRADPRRRRRADLAGDRPRRRSQHDARRLRARRPRQRLQRCRARCLIASTPTCAARRSSCATAS